jgi:type II secretory pathway pseudopilin PulG
MTLLEVLVAVAILGASMGALVAAAGRALAVVKQARDYEAARRMLARAAAENPLWLKDEIEAGSESGRFEGADAAGWSWERVLEEVETSGESGEENEGLFLMTLRVHWPLAGGGQGTEETVEYLFVPKNAAGERTLKPAT